MLPPSAFEWDEAKRRSNLAEHGLDFVAAVRIFEGAIWVRQDRRRDYGEDRFQAIGTVQGRVVFVTFTWRGEVCRIIQARIASREERSLHQAFLAKG